MPDARLGRRPRPLPSILAVVVSAVASVAASVSASDAPNAVAAGGAAGMPARPDRPNLVIFLVDDLGWQDLSLALWRERTGSNERFRTPNVERLAAQGVRFTQAYACAVCTPTRVSLVTGQNAARHRVTNWILFPDRDPSGRTARLESPRGWRMAGLDAADTTLPRLLQGAGYRTIHVGKAHWGAKGTEAADPRNLGFDVNVAGHAAGGPGGYTGLDGFGAADEVWAIPGLDRYHGLPTHLTEALTVEANREVEAAVAEGRPFFLYLAHYAVHAPIRPHDPMAQAYRDQGLDEAEARYASMVEGVDQSLGAVLRTLDRLGVAEETIVVFTSDNGGLSVHSRGRTPRDTGANTHNWPLRSGKGSAYEGGIRVPLVIAFARRDPEHALQRAWSIEEGGERDEPAILEDLFPTLLRLAAVDLETAPARRVMDGRDVVPLLGVDVGARAEERRARAERPLIFHYPHVWGPSGPGYEPHSSIRLGRFKAIWFHGPRRWELYDLEADIGEERDLARERPEVLRALATRLLAELDERGALWPTNRETGEPELPAPPG